MDRGKSGNGFETNFKASRSEPEVEEMTVLCRRVERSTFYC